MTALLPAHLTETLNNLGDAARALADEVRADKEQRAFEVAAAEAAQKRYNRRTTALLVIVALLVCSLAGIAVANRISNQQNAQIIRQIESCTTVGGDCYEQSTTRTNEVAEQLLRANIAVAICARTEDTPDAIEACVTGRVAGPSEAEEPPPSGEGPGGQPIPEPTE
jgi:hypothetical protein